MDVETSGRRKHNRLESSMSSGHSLRGSGFGDLRPWVSRMDISVMDGSFQCLSLSSFDQWEEFLNIAVIWLCLSGGTSGREEKKHKGWAVVRLPHKMVARLSSWDGQWWGSSPLPWISGGWVPWEGIGLKAAPDKWAPVSIGWWWLLLFLCHLGCQKPWWLFLSVAQRVDVFLEAFGPWQT